jgi:hypothetical protein
LHSIVSQIYNLRNLRNPDRARAFRTSAECNSAIRQITNLRYEEICPAGVPQFPFDKSCFAVQSSGMESNWAEENLQTIRTLMERSAIYRRALAPISTYVGVVGVLAALIGWLLKIETDRSFLIYWLAVSLIALSGAFFLVRRQALKDGERIWSPPTRRIAQAMLPALFIGLVLGLILAWRYTPGDDTPEMYALMWTMLYGLALHSAGFFMPRGIRLFGWVFVIVGLAYAVWVGPFVVMYLSGNLLMGVIFGGFHLAYGIYLYFTEPRKNAA